MVREIVEEAIARGDHLEQTCSGGSRKRSPAPSPNDISYRIAVLLAPSTMDVIIETAKRCNITKAFTTRLLVEGSLARESHLVHEEASPLVSTEEIMSRKYLTLRPERADFVCDPAHPPTDGLPRPARAILVGGAAEYGNVKKLPNLLWNEYGIAIVAHVTTSSDLRNCPRKAHFVLVLTDQTGHTIAGEVKGALEPGGKIVYAPSAWAHIAKGLADNHINPYPCRYLTPPAPVRHPVASKLEKRQEPMTMIRDSQRPTSGAYVTAPIRAPQIAHGEAERLLGLTLSVSMDEQKSDPSPPNSSPLPMSESAPIVSEPVSVPLEPEETLMSATPAVPRPPPVQVEKQPDLLLVVPAALVGRVADLLLALDTPAVRAVTGKSVSLESVVQIALGRGIELLEKDLGIGS
jgi:hypothetical protein